MALYLKISLLTNIFLNLSVLTIGRMALLFLKKYLVIFFLGKISLIGHEVLIDRDL